MCSFNMGQTERGVSVGNPLFLIKKKIVFDAECKECVRTVQETVRVLKDKEMVCL